MVTEIVAKKPRPVSYPATDEWRAGIRALMRERGIRQVDLARAIGCSEPTLTMLLRPGGNSKTVLMEPIHRFFGLPPPIPPVSTPPASQPPVDPVDAELRDVISRLDADWKTKLLDIAKNFPVRPKG